MNTKEINVNIIILILKNIVFKGIYQNMKEIKILFLILLNVVMFIGKLVIEMKMMILQYCV